MPITPSRSVYRTVGIATFGLVLIASSQLGEAAKPAAKSLRWMSDFDAALKEARRLNRPMIVHFYANWCGPCRRMDRETLHSAALNRQTNQRFFAVKINTDKHPKLTRRFNVRSLPSDLFLDPSGRVMLRTSGYQSSRQYLARVAHVDASFAKSQRVLAARNRNSQAVASKQPKTSIAAKPIAPEPPAEPPATTPSIAKSDDTQLTVGMGEFSPVGLWNHRKWVDGKSQFAAQHKGVTYYMADAAELRQFREHPDRYAPKLLGCDPVILNEKDRAIAGNIDFGAFFDGKLFFFKGDETRTKFRENPLRYIHTRHVLRIDHVGGTVRR